jgi:membrane protease subunit (stomatin/prohibitin family)
MVMFATDKKAGERMNLCAQCNKFNDLGLCTECGCVMAVKVKIEASSCPLNKWS